MPLDATQEMLTLGLCNVIGSFFHSMPVAGSFSRSAVNNASGVRTPLGGIYTGKLQKKYQITSNLTRNKLMFDKLSVLWREFYFINL